MNLKIFLAAFVLLGGCATGSVQQVVNLGAPLSVAKQGSFFVGGRDVKSDTFSLLPAYAASGTVSVDQMYVRYQVPSQSPHAPIVLIHGCCLTGKTWETTPDGRMGWDEYYLRKGHAVYVMDQTWRGRSASDISAINAVKCGKAPLDKLPTVFAAGREGAWSIFRFGPEYPKTFDGQRFPLSSIDEFWKQMVPDWLNAQPTPNPTVPALPQLAKQLRGVVLISHSQSGIYPFQVAQLDTAGIAAIVSMSLAHARPSDDMAPSNADPRAFRRLRGSFRAGRRG